MESVNEDFPEKVNFEGREGHGFVKKDEEVIPTIVHEQGQRGERMSHRKCQAVKRLAC